MLELPKAVVILPPMKLNITEILESPGMTPLTSGVAVVVHVEPMRQELPTESTLASVATAL